MSGFDDPEFFGERWADVYAEGPAPDGPDPAPAVEFLAGLAGGGRVLELAIGTGRVGLMAGQAGLRLAERYAGWDRRPFGSASTAHVSVYRPG